MLICSDQIKLYDVLTTVHSIILCWPFTYGFFSFAFYFSHVKQTELSARISTLERQNVELEETVKAMEGIFDSERGKGNFRKNNWAF